MLFQAELPFKPIATDAIQGLAAGVSWTIPAGTYVLSPD